MKKEQIGSVYTGFVYGKISWRKFLKSFKMDKKIVTSIPLRPTDLADAFSFIEKYDCRVDEILLNADTYTGLRKTGRDCLDPETRRSVLIKHQMGCVWGAKVIVSSKVPDKTVLVTGSKERRASIIDLSGKGVRDAEKAMELFMRAGSLKNDLMELMKDIEEFVSIKGKKIIRV